MKLFRSKTRREGFSLVEAVLSVGIMSFGFLALAPLLGLGLTSARVARENRTAAQIASTLIEQAKQGTLAAGSAYFDSASEPCPSAQAAYVVQESLQGFDSEVLGVSAAGAPLSRVIVHIKPVDGNARIYADVFPTPPAP